MGGFDEISEAGTNVTSTSTCSNAVLRDSGRSFKTRISSQVAFSTSADSSSVKFLASMVCECFTEAVTSLKSVKHLL